MWYTLDMWNTLITFIREVRVDCVRYPMLFGAVEFVLVCAAFLCFVVATLAWVIKNREIPIA
jgi:hypothetical protein